MSLYRLTDSCGVPVYWPGWRAFKIQFTNAEGKATLSRIHQGPGMTPEQAVENTTDFVRKNMAQVLEVSPQH